MMFIEKNCWNSFTKMNCKEQNQKEFRIEKSNQGKKRHVKWKVTC